MAGPKSAYRSRLFKGIHAEAVKRGLDHDALHDMVCERFGIHSMSQATDAQLEGVYRQWTGKTIKSRASRPRRGTAQEDQLQMVSGEELTMLAAEFAAADWGQETQARFIERQLQGRPIRTRGDWARVFNGIRAFNRRRTQR